MPDQTPNGAGPTSGGAAPASAQGTRARPDQAGNRLWMVAALTFLAGLVLGGAVVAASTSGDEGEDRAQATRATQTVPSAPTASVTEGPTVTVPAACLEVANSTDEVLALVNDAATAARDLNASELSSVVRELQQTQSDLRQKSSDCRSAAGDALPTPTAGT